MKPLTSCTNRMGIRSRLAVSMNVPAGGAVVLVSSELEEVLRLAQRIVVMRDRKSIGELDSQRFDLDGLIDFIANEGDGSAA